MSIVIVILVIGFTVIMHELGHFFAARRCGILVEEFAVGIGPKLYGVKKGDTVYSLRLFPIGGFCRMLGEEDGNPDERAFGAKPVWKRIIVISAGIIVNVLLALFVFFVFYLWNGYSDDTAPATIISVVDGYPAAEAGILSGDRLVRIGGTAIATVDDVTPAIRAITEIPASIEIIRDGTQRSFTISPIYEEGADGAPGRYIFGFTYGGKVLGPFETGEDWTKSLPRAGVLDGVKTSFRICVFYFKSVFSEIGKIFTGEFDLSNWGSIVRVGAESSEIITESAKTGPETVLWSALLILASISVSLAVFNLLPLPALDGGRLVFLFVEAVRGKPVSPEKEGIIHFAGFVLLMIFAAFMVVTDIMRLI